MITKLKLFIFFIFVTIRVLAQDPQLSQYYNAPLFLNPALTGTADNSRAVINYRSQWNALPSPFTTYAVSFDHYIGPYNSGVGLLIKRDRQGDAGLTSTDASLIYSYHVYLSDKITFVPAIQVGYASRDLNFSNLIFGDQITGSGLTNLPTADNFPKNGNSVSFLDISSGGILYADNFWIGYSGHHLNKPNQAFVGTYRLPIKSSFHAGYKFYMEKPTEGGMYYSKGKEKSISPTFMYKMQGKFDQFDLGVYGIFDPIMVGIWYRGLPIKKYEDGVNNNESLIFLAGIHHKGLSIGYSYDYTISSFQPGSGSTHELSLIYEFEIPYNHYKKKKRKKRVVCPRILR